jgi:hypothetical protein
LLADATGQAKRIAKLRITSTRPSTLSLMPEGLLQSLSSVQVRDLMTFLLARDENSRKRSPDGKAAVDREQDAAVQFAWQTATPESQGMSSAKLDALKEVIGARKTKAFLVIRNDKIVCEW